MGEGEMPAVRVPHDTMRRGLPGAKADVAHLGKHPVELIQEQASRRGSATQLCMNEDAPEHSSNPCSVVRGVLRGWFHERSSPG